jgi:hypothetical protein
MAARGEIEFFERTGHITTMRGEASQAYNTPPGEGTLELWTEHLEIAPPSMEPKAEVARRALVFAASEKQPWLAVQDYLKTDSPTRYQFLLHAAEEMRLDESAGKISLTSGPVQLDVYLISDQDLRFSQTSQFLVPPGERYEGAADQYHFTAETGADSAQVKFLALCVPYLKQDVPPTVQVFEEGTVQGFQIGEDRVAAWWGDGETGKLSEELEPGRLIVRSVFEGEMKTVLCE